VDKLSRDTTIVLAVERNAFNCMLVALKFSTLRGRFPNLIAVWIILYGRKRYEA